MKLESKKNIYIILNKNINNKNINKSFDKNNNNNIKNLTIQKLKFINYQPLKKYVTPFFQTNTESICPGTPFQYSLILRG